MGRVVGLGGAFLKAKDPEALYQWYETHLNLKREGGCFIFEGEEQGKGQSVVSFFPTQSKYFGPGSQQVMLNFRVQGLDSLLDGLAAAGVEVDSNRQSEEYGKFGWFVDPEGNRVELWEAAEP